MANIFTKTVLFTFNQLNDYCQEFLPVENKEIPGSGVVS